MRDERIEKWLRQRGVHSFHLREQVAIDLIDTKRSRHNNARHTSIVPGLPERYAKAYRDGAAFPPLIAHQIRDGIVLIDGNNRHEAALMAGVKRLDVYVVDVDEDGAAYLTSTANELNGVRCSEEERLDHAVTMVARGYPVIRAAEDHGVPKGTLETRLGFVRAVQRAQKLGVTHPANLPALVGRFAKIQSDVVFERCCKALRERPKASYRDVIGLTTRIRKATSEQAALDIVDLWVMESRPIAKSPGNIAAWGRLQRGLGLLSSAFDHHELVDQVPLTRREETAETLLKTGERMEELAGVLLDAASSE